MIVNKNHMGRHQKAMYEFACGLHGRIHSLANDPLTQHTAKSLVKRGLIEINEFGQMSLTCPVKVAFRVFPEDGSVIALFPELPWTESLITSYAIIGQYGGANRDLITELRPANRSEYIGLLRCLEGAGYDLLEVV